MRLLEGEQVRDVAVSVQLLGPAAGCVDRPGKNALAALLPWSEAQLLRRVLYGLFVGIGRLVKDSQLHDWAWWQASKFPKGPGNRSRCARRDRADVPGSDPVEPECLPRSAPRNVRSGTARAARQRAAGSRWTDCSRPRTGWTAAHRGSGERSAADPRA